MAVASFEDRQQPISEMSVLVSGEDPTEWSTFESVKMRAGVTNNFKEAESNLLTMFRINVKTPTSLTVGLSLAGVGVCTCFVCGLLLLDHVLRRDGLRSGAKSPPGLVVSPYQQSQLKSPSKSTPTYVRTATVGGSPLFGTSPTFTTPSFEVKHVDAQGRLLGTDSDGLLMATHETEAHTPSPPTDKSVPQTTQSTLLAASLFSSPPPLRPSQPKRERSQDIKTARESRRVSSIGSDAWTSIPGSVLSPMFMAQLQSPSTLASNVEGPHRLYLPVASTPSFGPGPDDGFRSGGFGSPAFFGSPPVDL